MKTASKIIIMITSLILLGVIFSIDNIISPEISLLFFYILLVFLVSNIIGGNFAYVFTIIAALTRTYELSKSLDVFAFLWNLSNFLGSLLFLTFMICKKNKLLAEIEKWSYFDCLTELPNRRAFQIRLKSAVAHSKRYQEKISVAFIDVDRFKSINDKFGHDRGDQLLKLIGNIIIKDLREDDMASRLGGDEFSVLYINSSDSLSSIGRLKSELDIAVQDKFDVSFSIGLIDYFGDLNGTAENLLKKADEMMYEVKKSSKNGIKIEKYA